MSEYQWVEFRKYEVDFVLTWKKDPRGKAGALTILPEADAGSFDYLPNVHSILQQLAPIREMLIQGDLRPLFLGWLACCWDPEASVPPIPAGLNERNEALETMLDLYELDDALVDAVESESLPLPARIEQEAMIDRWLAKQKKADLQERLRDILSDNASTARNRLLRDIRAENEQQTWPTTKVKMRVSDLRGDG
ncbi:MAG: hypothetical protein WD049_05290 [Candidatus Paceibacterota bacterium]